ncbi:MAG: hypothetical protein LBL58_05840 [Tannerellaceae bacterium]|jgi:hypothetical protein|nr:hypothetical protein [Tannerellaceae bacterium]
MNTYFNLNRVNYLLRVDWVEHRKSLLLGLGGVLLVWIALLYFVEPKANVQSGFFFVGGLAVFIYYCRFIGKKIHQPKGLYYTLPASNEEKYFTLLVEGLLFFLVFVGIFWLGLGLFKLLSPAFVGIGLTELCYDVIPLELWGVVSSVIFLSHIAFRKYALLIVVTGIALYVLLFTGVSLKIVSVASDAFNPYFMSSFAYEALDFMKSIAAPVLVVATIVVLYIGYLKLKEKELR